MGPREMGRHARLDDDAKRVLVAAQDRLALTGRGYDRVRRVARTLADLEGEARIDVRHVVEALQYRVPRALRAE